jgi:hypothetical protein
MKRVPSIALRFEQAGRWPRLPALPPALLLSVGVVLVAWLVLAQTLGEDLVLCALRRLTGLPCPTCGSTRLVLAVLEGRLGLAFELNPLVAGVGFALLAWLVLRVVTARRARLECGPRGARVLLGLGIVALLLNWAYLLRSPLHRLPTPPQERAASVSATGSPSGDRQP